MRKQHFLWTYLVLATVLTVYGGYTLIYHFRHNDKLHVLSLIFLIVGGVMFLAFLVLLFISLRKQNKATQVIEATIIEPEPEKVIEEKVESIKEEAPVETIKTAPRRSDVTYVREKVSVYDADDVYVKQVGYGPLLRVTGNRILDMRTNTYYRIQGNNVHQEGSGPVFEINGNSIRSAFGGYLYEISGSNINKVYGGFYASINGNYITLYDASEKYETTGSLNKKQMLAVAALLFGAY